MTVQLFIYRIRHTSHEQVSFEKIQHLIVNLRSQRLFLIKGFSQMHNRILAEIICNQEFFKVQLVHFSGNAGLKHRLNSSTCIIFHRTRPDLMKVVNTFRMGNISPYNYFIRGNFIPTLYNLTYPDILSNSGSFSRLNVKNSFLS